MQLTTDLREFRLIIPGDLATDIAVAIYRMSDAVLSVALALSTMTTELPLPVVNGITEINLMVERINTVLKACLDEATPIPARPH